MHYSQIQDTVLFIDILTFLGLEYSDASLCSIRLQRMNQNKNTIINL